MRVLAHGVVLASLLIGLSFAGRAEAQAQTFTIRPSAGSRIQFVSDAPLETMTGVSSHVSGTMSVNPEDLSTWAGSIRVQIASIRTGIDLRDEHLRSDNWLDAANHPDAIFEITSVEGASRLVPNELTRIRIHGHFSLHGVTHDIVASASVRFIPAADGSGAQIRGQARFRVRLTDFNVSVPLPVRLKVANEIRVNVSIQATAG